MAPNAKKRKAAELDGEPEQTELTNGHPSPNAEGRQETPPLIGLDASVVPFKVTCPALQPKKKSKSGKQDIYGPEESDGGFPKLKISYTIKPGTKWAELKPYRNFIVADNKFSLGSHVYISHPQSPKNPSDYKFVASDEKSEPDFWVAQVLEVRASGPEHVYLRVFWLYWPDELPGGRKAYHGINEVVMSNHMDLIDAMTVSGAADAILQRQLKGTIIECGLWLHEQCLIKDVLEKTYKRLVTEGKEVPLDQVETLAKESTPISTPKPGLWGGSLGDLLYPTLRTLKVSMSPAPEPKPDSDPVVKAEATPGADMPTAPATPAATSTPKPNGKPPKSASKARSKAKKGTSTATPEVNDGIDLETLRKSFSAKIETPDTAPPTTENEGEKNGTTTAVPPNISSEIKIVITDLRPGKGGKNWKEDLSCLKCRSQL
ncbi:putative bah domain-containing protein [Phaeomoniella chlamydospora]|uniref:Putative bah domain-containing protein n=1 Tax=Phaeomoniella chlamydospora TaxID=158046 RepID=A0A0G2FRP9_PHACM|nr:putative bah domain-containing protein [Phaeomoniella chlamydospora]